MVLAEKIMAYYISILIIAGMVLVSLLFGIINTWLFLVVFLVQLSAILYLAYKDRIVIEIKLEGKENEHREV